MSVGEANAAAPIIKHLYACYPQQAITVTCTTPTGSKTIESIIARLNQSVEQGSRQAIQHCYLPYDQHGASKRFLRQIKPRLGIIMETELWPSLMFNAKQQGVRMLVVNLRLSDKSYRAYAKIDAIMRPLLQRFDAFAVQYRADAQRLQKLGASAGKINLTGNMKFDIKIDQQAIDKARIIRKNIGERLVWIAASTHQGEDEVLLDVHRQLQAIHADLLLVLVPRHPERFNDVADLAARQFSLQRYSEQQAIQAKTDQQAILPDTNVYLLDTMGELASMIALSDVAFIGGSLVPVGGHNVLEACSVSVAAVFGPYMHNFDAIAQMVLEAKAGHQVENQQALLNIMKQYLSDSECRMKTGQNGLKMLQKNQGALQKVFNLIDELQA